MRPWTSLAKILLAVALVAALGTTTRAQSAGGAIEIAVIVPLTGPGALLGQTQVQGLQLIEKRVNASGGIRGRQLHFTFTDDQSNPQISVQLANQIIAAHRVQVVFGGSLTATCRASIPLFATNGPVFYCLTPNAIPPPGSYAFTSGLSARDNYEVSLKFFHHMGWDKVAALNSTDASGADVDVITESFLQEPENRGLDLVDHDHFGPNDVSINAQVAKLKSSGAQGVVMWGVGPALGTAFRSMHDAGVDIPVSANPSIMLYSEMQQYGPILPSHLYFASTLWTAYSTVPPGPFRNVLNAYFGTFKSAGVTPDNGQITIWDPAQIIIGALRHLGPDATATQIRDYLETLHGFWGTNGLYDFRKFPQRGLGAENIVMVEWRPAAHTWVPVWFQNAAEAHAAGR